MQWIDSISDAELLDYLPQLVQVGHPGEHVRLARPTVTRTRSHLPICPVCSWRKCSISPLAGPEV